MEQTTLQDTIHASALRTGEYRGAQTAGAFGDVAAEFATLRSGCGVYDLGWRSKLLVTGEDRLRWLNGMVTNNIKDLPLNRGNYNFLLNAQGRIQGDMYVYNRGDHAVIDTDASQKEHILDIFNKFIIMDDVEVSDASEKLTAIGLRGPKSKEMLQAAGINSVPSELLQVQDVTIGNMGVSVVSGSSARYSSYEVWLAPQNASAIWDLLIKSEATPVGSEALELMRIADGTPRYGVDIRERDLPQETGQSQALNFRKGCYVGQEIVERIHSRGAVHRKFTGFLFTGNPPAAGSKIQAGGKDIGEITSIASLPPPNGTKNVGLGYIRQEAGTPGTEVNVGETRAVITSLPFELL